MQMDAHTFCDPTGIHHQFRRPVYEVTFIDRDIIFICRQMNPRLLTLFHIQLVIHPNRLHDHADFVISILPFS